MSSGKKKISLFRRCTLNTKKIVLISIILIVFLPLIMLLLLIPAGGNSPLGISVFGSGGGEILGLPAQEDSPDDGYSYYPQVSADKEMRAVWIGYPDFSDKPLTAEIIEEMVWRCRSNGINAIFFHVRPFGDALYDSDYFPWSHLISGVQGAEPADGFDPLAYITELAHENGMELHAWVNPLRIQLDSGLTPSALSANNPYNKYRNDIDTANDHFVVDYKLGKYYNIGESEVRELIVNGIAEIAAKYDVDGIHWDDYFYPAHDESFDDAVSYSAYTRAGGALSLLEWRTQNVSLLVRDSYAAVKAVAPECVFGISPQGNIGNCLNAGANVYEWCSSTGYIDYICPQMYWAYDYADAPFEERLGQWNAMITNADIRLYVGLALYKAGSGDDDGGWLASGDNMARELMYARSVGADGFVLYSYRHLASEQAAMELNNLKSLL